MIRVFELFVKLNLIKLSALDFFNKSMTDINIFEYACHICGDKHPDWKRHADYERQLITFENGKIVCYIVIIIRYKCPNCGHTHALLPESIIPYQSYSFLFIIAVMRDRYVNSLTVEAICDKYNITINTFYSWRKLFLKHKLLWLGMLENSNTAPAGFLEFISNDLVFKLKEFFLSHGYSFLQGVLYRRKAKSVPV